LPCFGHACLSFALFYYFSPFPPLIHFSLLRLLARSFHIPLIFAFLPPLLFLPLSCPYDPQNPIRKNTMNSSSGSGSGLSPAAKYLFVRQTAKTVRLHLSSVLKKVPSRHAEDNLGACYPGPSRPVYDLFIISYQYYKAVVFPWLV